MRLLFLAITLSACGVSGGMGQSTLVGQCAASDAACARRAPMAPIAVGSSFYPEVSTEIAGTTTPNLVLESSNPDVVAVEDGAFVGKSPGASAVLVSTDDGSVVDFVHVWVSPATAIHLFRRDGERLTDSLGLVVGEDITLSPALFSGAQRLGGQAQAEWSLSQDESVTILQDGASDRRRLRAMAPGKVTLMVSTGSVSTTVDVEVVQ